MRIQEIRNRNGSERYWKFPVHRSDHSCRCLNHDLRWHDGDEVLQEEALSRHCPRCHLGGDRSGNSRLQLRNRCSGEYLRPAGRNHHHQWSIREYLDLSQRTDLALARDAFHLNPVWPRAFRQRNARGPGTTNTHYLNYY